MDAIAPTAPIQTPIEPVKDQEPELLEEERQLALVLQDKRWQQVETYIREQIANFNDIRSLMSIADREEFHVQARAKAVIVDEFEKFLNYVYEVNDAVKRSAEDEQGK